MPPQLPPELCQEATRPLPGDARTLARRPPDPCQEATRPLPGDHRTLARRPPDPCQEATGPLPGDHRILARRYPDPCQEATGDTRTFARRPQGLCQETTGPCVSQPWHKTSSFGHAQGAPVRSIAAEPGPKVVTLKQAHSGPPKSHPAAASQRSVSWRGSGSFQARLPWQLGWQLKSNRGGN